MTRVTVIASFWPKFLACLLKTSFFRRHFPAFQQQTRVRFRASLDTAAPIGVPLAFVRGLPALRQSAAVLQV